MTSNLASQVAAKDPERQQLASLVEEFLAKQQVQELPVVQRPLLTQKFRIQNNVMREAEDAARLKALADKNCRQQQAAAPLPTPKRKVNVKAAHDARSSAYEAERKRLGPIVAEYRAQGMSTEQICIKTGRSRAYIQRVAKEAGISLNRDPRVRSKKRSSHAPEST